MKRTEIDAQARVALMQSEFEWLENHKQTLRGLTINTIMRITFLQKQIEEAQTKK